MRVKVGFKYVALVDELLWMTVDPSLPKEIQDWAFQMLLEIT